MEALGEAPLGPGLKFPVLSVRSPEQHCPTPQNFVVFEAQPGKASLLAVAIFHTEFYS